MLGELRPWIVGDFSTLAAWENDQESKVWDMVESFQDDRWLFITAEDVDKAMEFFGIDYPNLPQYLKDVIDEEINII